MPFGYKIYYILKVLLNKITQRKNAKMVILLAIISMIVIILAINFVFSGYDTTIIASEKSVSSFLSNPESTDYVKGQFIIKLKKLQSITISPIKIDNYAKIGIESIDKLNQKYEVQNILPAAIITPKSAEMKDIFEKAEIERIFIFKVPKDSDILKIVNEYSKDPNVEFVQPDYIIRIK